MHRFHYLEDRLHCEDVSVSAIAEAVGTPFYLYSHATLEHHFRTFNEAYGGPHLTCFSVKSLSNIAVLRLFGRLGGGADVVSGGELYRALQAGIPPQRICYSGVGKTRQEIDAALEADILMFNVESSPEMDAISARAQALGRVARVALRINPDVDPKTHPYISTGLKKNKFGIAIEVARAEYARAAGMPGLEVCGVDCHIGSQLTRLSPFVDSLRRLKGLLAQLKAAGIAIRYLDLGGGLGITYDAEKPPHPDEYGQAMERELKDCDVTVIFEPGRVIVGNAGILVTRVVYVKEAAKRFIIVDAGMNDLVRPALYGSYHALWPVVRVPEVFSEAEADVVGPICESTDFLAQGRKLPLLRSGDLLAAMSAGAYGFTMASNYNSRPRVPEILVKEDKYFVIRERESYAGLVAGERIPDFLLRD
ncbi:MAG: diaminopimelate decarboxylase [Pseudomonadota bacterium]